MFFWLFLAFTLLPLAELMLLFRLAALMGPFTALVLVLGTGFFGAALARREGVRTLGRLQQELGAGKIPAQELMDAFTLLAAGLLLITPGVLTDATGFALLFKPTRRVFQLALMRYFKNRVVVGSFPGFGGGPSSGPSNAQNDSGTINAEYSEVDEDQP